MPPRLNLTGKRFGRLTAVTQADQRGNHTYWMCSCDCGSTHEARTNNLRSGQVASCGCTHVKHGLHKHPLYSIHKGITSRCYRKNDDEYKNYGGRGISTSSEWLDLRAFIKDMKEIPFKGAQIDRIDNNKGYCKENCRWSTPKENARNKRSNRSITFDGRTACIAEWEEILGFNSGVISQRLNTYNWSEERSLTTPSRIKRKSK